MQGSGDLSGVPKTRWLGWLAGLVSVVVPLLQTLDRFRRPYGDKFMFPNLGGSSDLWLPYLGARAIVEHLDPYGPLPVYLREPSGWPSTYPPTMLALYVPLVWATHADIELACQVFYWINIVALGALSFIVWRLALRLCCPDERQETSFLVILMALTLNGLTMFAIDRSQSEIVSAALCWGAILLFLRGQHGWAMAAVTFAGAIKGYAVPVGVGLLLATRGQKQILRAVAAATAVGLLVTVPVAGYLKHGFTSMLVRAEYSWVSIWFNHSFKNAFYQFAPKLGDSGRRFMLVSSLLVMLAAWVRLLLAKRRGTSREVTLRVIVFAGAALALMIGLPVYSGPYNYLLVLPAMILASTRYRAVCEVLRLNHSVGIALGAALVMALGLALRLRLLDHPQSLAGVGLVLFVFCLGVMTVAGARRPT